jgi:hypothetical protein
MNDPGALMFMALPDHVDEGTTFVQNVGHYLPVGTAQHPRRLEYTFSENIQDCDYLKQETTVMNT